MSQYTYKCEAYKDNFRHINAKAKESFVRVREKKSIGNFLFLFFTILITPFVYLLSPFMFIYDLLNNQEYSKDYLEYQIEQNSYNKDGALLFLETKQLEYQRRKIDNLLSYSESKHNGINETFGYLFRKYNNVESIADSLNEKTDKTRLIDFQSSLGDQQIELLAQCINKLRIFEKSIDTDTLEAIFSCEIDTPIRINRGKNKLLAYLFCELSYKNLISFEWQSICSSNQVFMSHRDIVLTQNNYSSTVYDVKENPPKDSHIIDNYLKQLKAH